MRNKMISLTAGQFYQPDPNRSTAAIYDHFSHSAVISLREATRLLLLPLWIQIQVNQQGEQHLGVTRGIPHMFQPQPPSPDAPNRQQRDKKKIFRRKKRRQSVDKKKQGAIKNMNWRETERRLGLTRCCVIQRPLDGAVMHCKVRFVCHCNTEQIWKTW